MHRQSTPLALGVLLLSVTHVFAQGDATAGKTVFENQCASCHSAEAGKQGFGPSLAGVMGRQSGTLSGYNERFNGIDKRLDDIKAMIGTRQQGQLEGPTPTKLPFKYDPAADVFPDWVGIEGDPNKAPIDWKAMGVEKPTGKFWIFNPK